MQPPPLCHSGVKSTNGQPKEMGMKRVEGRDEFNGGQGLRFRDFQKLKEMDKEKGHKEENGDEEEEVRRKQSWKDRGKMERRKEHGIGQNGVEKPI